MHNKILNYYIKNNIMLYIMLLIEFDYDLKYGLNIIKYRNVEDDIWYYI
jgi:hypothetical protein